MLKPVTPAVKVPRLAAARAVVDKWPIETILTITMLYSSHCALHWRPTTTQYMIVMKKERGKPEYRQGVSRKYPKFLPKHLVRRRFLRFEVKLMFITLPLKKRCRFSHTQDTLRHHSNRCSEEDRVSSGPSRFHFLRKRRTSRPRRHGQRGR